jgi:quercetin dioxygenase-like cupin family protein
MIRLSTTERRWTRRALIRAGIASATVTALPAVSRSAEADGVARVSLQAFDKAQPQEYPWGWIRWLMNSQIDPSAEMTLGMVYIKAHQTNPVHIHPNSAEYLHVLAGACEHRIGDRWVALKTGDTLRIPKGIVHGARTGAESCRVMVCYDTGTRQMVPVADPVQKS